MDNEIRPINEIIYTDVFEMADAILTHVKESGGQIKLADDPYLRRLGFATESGDKRWAVGLTAVKTIPDRERGKLYKSYLCYVEGRAELARIWSTTGVDPTNAYVKW